MGPEIGQGTHNLWTSVSIEKSVLGFKLLIYKLAYRKEMISRRETAYIWLTGVREQECLCNICEAEVTNPPLVRKAVWLIPQDSVEWLRVERARKEDNSSK